MTCSTSRMAVTGCEVLLRSNPDGTPIPDAGLQAVKQSFAAIRMAPPSRMAVTGCRSSASQQSGWHPHPLRLRR
ncbi:MAG: hypothetical protein LIP09_13750 [Bacteroidales bacterium]|nr:hypothetical protein [Bacteroidales bacterium]